MKKFWFGVDSLKNQKIVSLISNTAFNIAPNFTTEMGFKFLCNPFSRRDIQLPIEPNSSRDITTQLGNVRLYQFGNLNHKVALLGHGWADNCRSLTSLIQLFLDNQYCVYAFDQIGHGNSEGKVAHLFGFIDSWDKVINELEKEKKITSIVSHSMGCLAVLNQQQEYLIGKKIVFLSPPTNFFDDMLRNFSRAGLPEELCYALLEKVSAQYNTPWRNLSLDNNHEKLSQDFMVVHDINDSVCSYEESSNFYINTPVKYKTTNGLGHRRALKDKEVQQEIVSFIS
ncbi:MAG: alpha/beta hydrolase [Bdellovibrionales bacterium]